MTTHTPGPWAIVETECMKGFPYRIDGSSTDETPTGFSPCAVYGDGKLNAGVALANARLIAAAPQLLTALRAYMAWDATDVDAPCVCIGPYLCHRCTARQAWEAISAAAPTLATCDLCS